MKKYFYTLILAIIVSIPNIAIAKYVGLSYNAFETEFFSVDAEYYDTREIECVQNSIVILNALIKKYGSELPKKRINVVVKYYNDIRLGGRAAVGMAEMDTPVKGTTSLRLLKLSQMTTTETFLGITPRFKSIDFKIAYMQSTIVHELTHAYLFAHGVQDLAIQEYLAYSLDFLSIPTRYRIILNIDLKNEYGIIGGRYQNSDFIVAKAYLSGPHEYGVLSYNHFVKTNGELFSKMISGEFQQIRVERASQQGDE